GTLLLVSHDRAFLDNVVTSTFVFEGDGRVQEYVGGYEDWLRQTNALRRTQREDERPPKPDTPKPGTGTAPKKLLYKEQREFDALPEKIEALEAEKAALAAAVAHPEFYKEPRETIDRTLARQH